MKRILKILVLGILGLILMNCTTAPLTGRSQLKLVDDQELATSSESQYRQLINGARSKGLLVNSTPDGQRLSAIGSRISKAVET